MKTVSILCTDPAHPVMPWLRAWVGDQADTAKVSLCHSSTELVGGDFLFLVSCHQIIGSPVRDLFRRTLVLHASNLPQGRGMSPHVWQVLRGADRLCVSLLNAEDALDSGDIWHQADVSLDGTELHEEIHRKLFAAELELMSWALANCDVAAPRKQVGEPSHFRKRTPADSQVDPARPLAEFFDLLRVADPERYPAFFEMRGCKYRIRIDKL